jgi:hypothetical protein
VSTDGSVVTFHSGADNLVHGDVNRYWDVFAVDLGEPPPPTTTTTTTTQPPTTTTTTTTVPDDGVVVIPLDTVVRGDPGSTHLVAEVKVPASKVGLLCSVQATNNRSVHPDTNLIVSSDSSTVTLADVERERHVTTDSDSLLRMGETATVKVQLGGHGVFSGGLKVGLCETATTCSLPALTLAVAPQQQQVAAGGTAKFTVTVTNSGDEPFTTVDIDATANRCDAILEELPVRADSSYRCIARRIQTDLEVGFHAEGHGGEPGCGASADATAQVTVQPDTQTTTTTTTTTQPPAPPAASTTTTTVPPPPPPEPVSFVDDDDSIFEGDIEWLAAAGVTRGCNPPLNDSYCPDNYVTRGQMAAFLVRAMGYTVNPPGDRFVDDNDSIFEEDIERLAAAAVTKGCNPPTNNRYCADSYVTRGQMAAFLVRALGLTDNPPGDRFVDDNDSIFEEDIERLAAAAVTRGCNPPANNRYCPTSYVTRGQMAAFLHRALE